MTILEQKRKEKKRMRKNRIETKWKPEKKNELFTENKDRLHNFGKNLIEREKNHQLFCYPEYR